MADIGKVTLEIKPTVTLESAVACVYMLNTFLEDNDEYRLEIENDSKKKKWVLTDKPVTRDGALVPLSDDDKEILDDMPNLKKLFENMGARFE